MCSAVNEIDFSALESLEAINQRLKLLGVGLHLSEVKGPVMDRLRTSHLINELADGRIDAAIVALPVSEPAFTEVALFEEKFVLVRPEADRDKPTPDRARLTEMKLLLLEEGHCFRDQALSFCDIQSDKAREALDASSLSTLVQMVGAGIGVTLIPEIAVAVETQSARVAVCSFPEPQPTRTVGMIWRKTNPLSAKLLGIADLIRAA